MTADVINLAQARKAKIIRDAKAALSRGLIAFPFDTMAAWQSEIHREAMGPHIFNADNVTILPCDTEPA